MLRLIVPEKKTMWSRVILQYGDRIGEKTKSLAFMLRLVMKQREGGDEVVY